MKRTAKVLVLGLFLAGVASAQPAPREKWITATSGPFTVYSNAKPAKTREVLLALEQLGTVISAMSPADAEHERPTILYAFASRDSVSRYFSTPPRPDVVHMAEYLVGPDATHIVLNAAETPAEVLPWVYRAYLGQELLRRFPQLPLWARSGLGHFYATLQVEKKGSVRIGRPDRHHLEMLNTVNWIPLGQFFGVNSDSAVMRAGTSRQIFEAQAWLLTHYLMTVTTDGERPAASFFAALDSGLTPEESIRQVFGTGIEGFERNLNAYAGRMTMSSFKITLDDLPQGDYELRSVTLSEMSLRLGQHLVRAISPPPVEAAERHLEPLFQDPELAGDALAALGELRHRSARIADATALYDRALEARPRQALSYLNYAKLLAETGATLEARRQALESALEIDPALGEAWAGLAETHQSGDATDYAKHLDRALQLMPERADLAYNLVIAHLRAEDPITARQIVAQRLRNPDHREIAADAEREIVRFETVSASNRDLLAGDLESAVTRLEGALSRESDPGVRAQIQGSLERLEHQALRGARIDDYNEAVALLNAGRLDEARERLTQLLPTVEDAALRASIEETLARLDDSL